MAQQARLTVATGERLVDDGDLFGALPWFAAALRLEEGDLLIALGSEDQLFASAALLK